MCGISGIFQFHNFYDVSDNIVRMNEALAHRGPDNAGIYLDGPIALGHRRLSIIDLSEAGKQPLFSYDQRYCIIFNGELYNYRQIKNVCTSYPFQTNTDTEVILAAYSKWGKNCLQHFNGMFAFAIWDTFKKELFIARDRLGVKPLYYYKDQQKVLFSSEIRSLLKSGLIPKKINPQGVVDFLQYQTVHAPHTIIQDVYMLMPGHFMVVNEEGYGIEKYWEINYNVYAENSSSYTDVCEQVKKLLYDAVERRLVADVPFGAFLSGGIDSSAVVGIMSEVATEKVKTFSVVFDEEKFSEAKYARLVAAKFKTEHHEIKLTPQDFLDSLPHALHAMDHPSGDGPNTFIVSKVTKAAGISMALSGLGGDEVFCGYNVFKQLFLLNRHIWISQLPQILRANAGRLLKLVKPGIASNKIGKALSLNRFHIVDLYPIIRQIYFTDDIQRMLCTSMLAENQVAGIIDNLSERTDSNGILSKISFLEISTYLQNVLLRDTDQMSMAHALEVREPFLDHTLIEYVMSLPDAYKYPTSPKKLLTDSLGELLPKEVVHRPKMGFTLPWADWLKRDVRQFTEDKLFQLSNRSLFNRAEILSNWHSFLKGDPRLNWVKIWSLVVLESWLESNEIEL